MGRSHVKALLWTSLWATLGAWHPGRSAPVTPSEQPPESGDSPLSSLPYTPGLDLASMDQTVDPCQDFYQYSCGGWIRRNPIPLDKSRINVYSKLAHENNRYLWGTLQRLGQTDPRTLSPDQKKLSDFFSACMDETQVEERGVKPLLAELAAMGPLESRDDLARMIARVHKRGGQSHLFFDFDAEQDFVSADDMIAAVYAGGLGLPDRDYYFGEDDVAKAIFEKYRLYIIRLLTLTGLSSEEAARDAETILTIERALARATLSQVEKRDPYKLYHKYDLAALQSLTPSFRWADYLEELGTPDVDVVNVTEPAFFAELENLWRTQSLDHLQTYVRWTVINGHADQLNQEMSQASFDFYDRTIEGTLEMQPRWLMCVNLTGTYLRDALGQEYVRENFGSTLKESTLRMVHQIEDAMAARIESSTWMSGDTKKNALIKLRAIANKIGYPEQWTDYQTYDVKNSDFFGNIQRGSEFARSRRLAQIGHKVDRTKWDISPFEVNAFYSPQLNDMNFPAGVLQPPLFDPKMDAGPNYGNTGGTIGHELIHAFDDQGRQFDDKGNLKNWWKEGDEREFNRRAQCIMDQYKEYVVVDDLKINSQLTIGEDLADLSGLQLAWLAWQAEIADQPQGKNRDGFSPEQRFFIGFAQWACENVRPEKLRASAAVDPHSPGRYRINGVLVNMPEFERAFQCSPSSPMVKANRCEVW